MDTGRSAARWQGEIRQAEPGDADEVADLATELAMSFELSRERFRASYRTLLTADGT